jgi:uncharacterized protein (UPF0371 family)
MSLNYCKKLLPNWSIEELKCMHYLDLSFTKLTSADLDLLCKNLKNLKGIKLHNAHYIKNDDLQDLQLKYKNITFDY